MKPIIKKITLPEPTKRTFSTRCSRMVFTSGTGVGRRPQKRCRRFATHVFNGVSLCTQHAGELALNHLMQPSIAAVSEEVVEVAPEDATHYFQSHYYKKGPHFYAYYFSKGSWRESGIMSNEKLRVFGEPCNSETTQT